MKNNLYKLLTFISGIFILIVPFKANSLILYDNPQEILKDLNFRGDGKYLIQKGPTNTEIILKGNLVYGVYYSDTPEGYKFCFSGVLQNNVVVGTGKINTTSDSNVTEPLGEYEVDSNLVIIGRQTSQDGWLNFESIVLDLTDPENIEYLGQSESLSISCFR